MTLPAYLFKSCDQKSWDVNNSLMRFWNIYDITADFVISILFSIISDIILMSKFNKKQLAYCI